MDRPIPCTHCGYAVQGGRLGLCRACYAYQWRHAGRPRPLAHPTHCCVCTDRLRFHDCRALCTACFAAARRRGLRAADVYAGPGIAVLRQTRAVARRRGRVQQEAG